MCIQRYIRLFIALMLSFFIYSSSYADNVLKEDDVEKFKLECWSNQDYDLDLRFAPVRKLSGESGSKGQWSYEFATEDRQYPENRIKLPESGAVRVDLVSILKKSDSAKGESYLWIVIVGPRVTGWGFGGHWPTTKPINEYQRLRNKRDSLISMATLSAHEGQPVHTKISPRDIDSAGTLNNAWEDIFGIKIVTNLVYLATKGAQSGQRGYSLTFYYMPTPALRFINEKGYKWPSFKHIDKPGKVYGFVLTPEGECLAWDSVDVVR